MKKSVFISYSHQDIDKVKRFALMLSLYGYDIWMDEKILASGEQYTSKILEGIHDSDVYMVFMSKSSLGSSWVNAEIDFALREKIERGLIIVPVLLEDVEIPVALMNINYLDARFSLQGAVKEFAKQHDSVKIPSNDLSISYVSFSISKNTSVEVGPFNEMSLEDLKEDCSQITEELRKKAYGILMNFVPLENFKFTQAAIPKFSNGLYEESVQKVAGSFEGGVRENISVEAVVFKPDQLKLDRLLKNRLEILNLNALTFGFDIPLQEGESFESVGKKCLQKLQDEYIILTYDVVDGAKVELDDDFYLALNITGEVLRVKLSSSSVAQFKKKLQGFSVGNFVSDLLK